MAKHPVADIRNVAFVGHGAVGKTTLSDLMLFKSGAVTRAGSVDDGSSVLDSDEEAKHHKHSITSTLIHFTHAGKHINVIDTPGYPDFIGQAIGALRAVETAIVTLSAAAGIEVNTRRTFNLAGAAGLGRMVVVNKCDLENINFDRLLDSIRETFGNACVPMNLPVGLGPKFSGVVSTLEVPSPVPAERRRRSGRMEPGRDGRDRRSRRIADGALPQRRSSCRRKRSPRGFPSRSPPAR